MAKTTFKSDADFVKNAQGRIEGWDLEIIEAQGSPNFLKGKLMKNEKAIDSANRLLLRHLVNGGLQYLGALKAELDAEEAGAPTGATDSPATGAEGETKRKRRTKEEIAADEAAKKAQETEAGGDLGEDDDLADFGDETPKKEVTPEDVRTKLVEYAQKHSKDKAYAVLEKFAKDRKTASVKPADLPKLYAELEAGLK